jgi:hypothetical protein
MEPNLTIDLHLINGVMFGFEFTKEEDYRYIVFDLFIVRIMFITKVEL